VLKGVLHFGSTDLLGLGIVHRMEESSVNFLDLVHVARPSRDLLGNTLLRLPEELDIEVLLVVTLHSLETIITRLHKFQITKNPCGACSA
jgi:hypothetical protein